MSDSLRPHELQHTRLLCPLLSLRVCLKLCSSNRWCYLTISSFTALFSSCPQSFPASESFPKSWLFASGGQSIRGSASASVFLMNIQGWFPLGLTGLISLLSKGLSRVISNTTVQKHRFFSTQLSLDSSSHFHTGKTVAFTRWTFGGKVMFLLFNMLSRLVITFLPRNNRLLILV